MQPYTRGFTLIELLVVIAIIAILAGIIFPVLSRARNRAYLATCTSNARQLGQAVTMYVQDYDGFFPYAATILNVNEGSLDAPFLREVVEPYVRADGIWFCPAFMARHGDLFKISPLWREANSSYAYNAFPQYPDGSLYGVSISSVRFPSEKPMLWCSSGVVHGPSPPRPSDWANGATGAVNICYVDTHVDLFVGNLTQFENLIHAPR